MPRWLFPLLVVVVAALAALLAWLWWSDFLLIDRCVDAGGAWDEVRRSCMLAVTPARP